MSITPTEPDPNYTQVRIGLPLPMDVTSSLMQVLGLAWPGALIGNGTQREMVLLLPKGVPVLLAKEDAAEQLLDAVQVATEETEGFEFTEMGPGRFGMSMPEDMVRFFAGMAGAWFEHYPQATNYLEQKLIDPSTNRSFVVIVQRHEGKSPHDLREMAEAELASVIAENRLLKAALTAAQKDLEPAAKSSPPA